ncbi:hypothetical protein BJX76DRAFT_365088 [Aspergillus varians]
MALITNPLVVPFMASELSYASPCLQGHPASLFGGSLGPVRSRRSNGSSSDESPTPSLDGFTEEDLRAGGPQLPEAPCITLHQIPRSHQYHAALMGAGSFELFARIGDICREENLPVLEMSFCGRRSIYGPGSDPILTLLIRARRGEVTERGWSTIARKLWNYLRGRRLYGISVEVIDPRFDESPKLHPCLRTDDISPVWRTVAEAILHHIGVTGIFTLGCFRIGIDANRQRCPPTVLFGVDRRAQRNWKEAREGAISVLESYGLYDVAVLIRNDTTAVRSGRTPAAAGVEDCRQDLKVGASIAPRSLNHGHGTLGGWVEIKNPKSGGWVPFILTCAHCCFPAEDQVSGNDLQVIDRWKKQGVYVNDQNKSRLLLMDSPSYRDMRQGIDNLTTQITQRQNYPVYRKVELAKAEEEFVISSDEREWRVVSRALAQLHQDRHDMQTFFQQKGYNLGDTFAASGPRVAECTGKKGEFSTRDWALVQPRGGRSVRDNVRLATFGAKLPENDEEVYKIGRATGFTTGTYANLKVCHIAGQVDKTWEHAVVVPQGGSFLAEGDSGSLLFNFTGTVMGMFFGGSNTGDIGYFTSTQDLLEDIKRITGATEIRILGDTN